MQLPSRFQIGDTVTVTDPSGEVAYDAIKVTGVQFTESKVSYLIDDKSSPYYRVPSEQVRAK